MWGRKTNNHHLFSFFFFFFPTFLNKAKIHQPNRNWQHSFKKQNKARPSWALTRLLYLFVSHMLGPCAIQLPLLWAGFLCSAFPSPPGTLKLFLWFLLCGTQLIQAPRSSPDSSAGSSSKLRQSSSVSLSQNSRAGSRGWKLILTLP